ncbi:glycosyltransferase family 2 protein [Streptomyces sp. NPDC005402]|uniref:glycosyltransferase family 2 protein n=1 Tax=Streptomyces sp. NPDC005402 TaxID=3155338 RepID=UPI0033A0963E
MTTSATGADVPPGVNVPPSRRTARMVKRQAAWKPGFLPFLVTAALAYALSSALYSPRVTLMGWVVTVLWTLPVVSSLVGVTGAALTRRRIARQRGWTQAAPALYDRLVVLVPTIGRDDTYPALERSVLSYCAFLPRWFPDLRIDILTEEGCEAAGRIDDLAARSPLMRVVTVPKAYRTPNGTRFKARANHYAHELRIAEGEALDDVWVLHMDDDTGVGPDTAEQVARFINAQRRAGPDGKHLAQGMLTYPRENAVNRLTWLADAIRPADDIARFAVLTGGGTPLAGLHGELLLLRASIEATIGWDFGPDSICEDAHLALVFASRYKGRSDWFSGRSYGASPATMRDFLKQRERWSWGLVGLAFNRSLPRRSRALLMYSVTTWVLGPFQHVGVVLAVGALLGDLNTSPVTPWILPLWAVTMGYAVWMYWEGLKINASVSANGRRLWWEPMAVIALMPFFALWEAAGSFRGLLRWLRGVENQFVVIAKPA